MMQAEVVKAVDCDEVPAWRHLSTAQSRMTFKMPDKERLTIVARDGRYVLWMDVAIAVVAYTLSLASFFIHISFSLISR
jgi:hypothetical protein